jgi:signal transduction histidine kinase
MALDQEGLAAGIRAYLQQMRAEAGPDFELVASLSAEPDPETRAIIYRIAQEALANVRKHANAAHVAVSLAQLDGGIVVKVKDNGRGFRVAEATRPKPGHLGLAAMQERAQMAGGWLRVESAQGRGTEIQYWIPNAVTSAEPAA